MTSVWAGPGVAICVGRLCFSFDDIGRSRRGVECDYHQPNDQAQHQAKPVLGHCPYALLIPVATGVFYPMFGVLLSPALAAGAMALSCVFVLINL